MNLENVKIKQLTNENWYDCCELELSDEQAAYMESNAVSIAQSKFEPTLQTFAIYLDEQVVGFVMFNSVKEELDGYWVYRIMIDKKLQGMGIGKAATKLMLAEMSKLPDANIIVVGYHPENTGAHNLYASLGFIDKGDRFGKEMAVIKYMEK
ncbi:GNAT family N-acetyltransferase [Virgibacillus flavescens]|uniref:GNAT family N-acetyltransferase n=1 Tax=Virgibacillus flavescens TaxID=1611422 RepID=UPI003D32E202